MSPRIGGRGRGRDAGADPLGRAIARALAAASGRDADDVRVEVEGVRAADLPRHLELVIDVEDEPEDAPVVEAPEASWVDEGGALGPDGNGGDADADADAPDAEAGDRDDEEPIDLDAEAEAAADLLEGLLDALDLDGDLQIRILDDHAEVEITDAGEGVLIGRRGQTLDAIQELTRSALQRRFQRRAHVVVDVDGYRARRVERLLERADEAIEEVRSTGDPQRLEPMDAFERKIVHQRVAEAGGLASHSSGREPARRVIIERD
jgi:spoIIIJ-associated protein